MDHEKLRSKFPGGVLRTHHPFYMADEIQSIPDCLSACIAPEIIEKIRSSVNGCRPGSIFTVGCGTSYNACQAIAYYLQKLLQVPAIAMDAYDFELDTPPGINNDCMVIGISESGQSITTCLSLEKSKTLGAFTVGISANPESRLAKTARLSLVDPFLHDIPLGKTRTYLSSAVLGILAGIMTRDETESRRFIQHVEQAIHDIRECSEDWQISARAIAGEMPKSQARYMVTGFGAQKANADEIRLKLLEVLGESATSFGLEEFTHGPSACFKDDLTVILLQADDRVLEKSVRVAQGVAFSDARLVVITDRPEAGWPDKAQVIPLPAQDSASESGFFTAITAAQYLFYHIALHKGLNPDVNLEDSNPELGDIYAFFFPPGTH